MSLNASRLRRKPKCKLCKHAVTPQAQHLPRIFLFLNITHLPRIFPRNAVTPQFAIVSSIWSYLTVIGKTPLEENHIFNKILPLVEVKAILTQNSSFSKFLDRKFSV